MFEKDIQKFKENGIYREIKDRESKQGRIIRIDGKDYINFASNDYLGLSSEDFFQQHEEKIIEQYGLVAGASRLLSGGTAVHRDFERRIAHFKGTGDALIFNSGYAANTGVIPAMVGENDVIFSDELNHASIIDGIRLSRAKKVIYRHGDIHHLRDLLTDFKGNRGMVVTETVFSMDGDLAPVEEIFHLCKRNGLLFYIDDAHGTGVFGNGRGILSHFDLYAEKFVIQMGTLSKAIGSFGAFIAADSILIEYLINTSRTLIYSTALPSVLVAKAYKAIELLTSNKNCIEKLWKNIHKVHNELESIGVNKGESETQIIPLIFNTMDETNRLSRYLMANGIYAPVIRPPTVKEPRVRFSITAAHSEDDLNTLVGLIKDYFR